MRRRRPHLLLELLIVLALLRVYDLIRGAGDVREGPALRHGADLLRLEGTLHLDVEHSLNDWTAAHSWVLHPAAYWYQYAHISTTMTVLLWLYVKRPEIYRWARTSLVLMNVIGLATFFLVPVAPPRLLPGAGFVDVSQLAGFTSPEAGPVKADQFGAMPSLHIAWALWTATVCFLAVRHTVLRRAWLVYPCVTGFAVVATGNHFVLDIVAGAAVGTAAMLHRGLPRPSHPAAQPAPALEEPVLTPV